jgi:hypothetical protein
MVVPQVILKFQWSSSEESSLTYKSSRFSIGWPMLWHRGGVPPIGIKVKDPTWGLSRATNGVIPTFGDVHKKYKIQVSTIYLNAILCINKKHIFYRNWWQRERSWNKDMKMHYGGEVEDGHGQRGSIIEEWRWIKILKQEKHTSRGSKFMNLIGCIWYVHIHVLVCTA